MIYVRPTMNKALLEAICRQDDDMAPTERRPDLQKAWAEVMTVFPEKNLARSAQRVND